MNFDVFHVAQLQISCCAELGAQQADPFSRRKYGACGIRTFKPNTSTFFGPDSKSQALRWRPGLSGNPMESTGESSASFGLERLSQSPPDVGELLVNCCTYGGVEVVITHLSCISCTIPSKAWILNHTTKAQ